MRTITLSVLFLFSIICAKAQQVSSFDSLTLSKADTFYVNYTSSGNDVGFNNGAAHFPCVYDTSFGGYWSYGFSYSNMTDSVTSGFGNQYSAKSAQGYAGSAKYAVAYGQDNSITMLNKADLGVTEGFYITNSTYAYNSMRDGDAFAKKFGGATGTDKDWFKLTAFGYSNGARTGDSVDFFLADFRTGVVGLGYIVNAWTWVDLHKLGVADSIAFVLNSSDTGSFGMNTPAYFCIDNLTVDYKAGVNNVVASAAKVYPNPAINSLHVSITDNTIQQLVVTDMTGKVITTMQVSNPEMTVNTAAFTPGMYILQLLGNGKTASVRFVKQ